MPITEKQIENRKNYIGSSDAPAIVGVDPWRSAADVWLEKTGQLEAETKDENDAIQVGRYCEDAILRWFSDKQGVKLIRNQFRVHENKITAAHLDALCPDKPEWLVEVKSTGITGGRVSADWGEVGTDEVPDRVAIQCQHQMAILPDVRIAWVPVLMGRAGFRLYRVERDEGMIADLISSEELFWNRFVLEHRMPDASFPNLETLKRVKRKTGLKVDISDDLVQAYMSLKDEASRATKAKEAAQAAIISALRDAEIGLWSGGEVRYLEVKRKAYEVKETTFRQLTFAKGDQNE